MCGLWLIANWNSSEYCTASCHVKLSEWRVMQIVQYSDGPVYTCVCEREREKSDFESS